MTIDEIKKGDIVVSHAGDRVSGYFVPTVMIIAIVTILIKQEH